MSNIMYVAMFIVNITYIYVHIYVYILCIAVRTVYESFYVHLQPPETDKCSMLATKHYDVRISNEDEVISYKIYNTINFLFEHLNYHLSFTFNISITVIDIEGQRSNSTVITKTISIQLHMCTRVRHQ